MKQQIPSKYLNNNVKAMICGGKSSIGIEQETKSYILHILRVFSLLRNKYRVEVLISKED